MEPTGPSGAELDDWWAGELRSVEIALQAHMDRLLYRALVGLPYPGPTQGLQPWLEFQWRRASRSKTTS